MRVDIFKLNNGLQFKLINHWKAWRPVALPPSWTLRQPFLQGGIFECSTSGLRVFASVELVRDTRPAPAPDAVWAHVSVSRKGELPTWEELKKVKFLFLGDRRSIQVFPSLKEWVNEHPNCLHLFAQLGENWIPDFRDEHGRL